MAEADGRCLDEDTVILLAEGALAGSAFERAERHLAHCGACRTLLAESIRAAERAGTDPARTETSDAGAQASAVPATLPEGELEVPPPGAVLVNKYRVEAVLGRGGMGVVLAATHLVLGNRVAIKVLRRPGPSEVARFLREARVSAQIRNRHIVRVFDFGQLPSGAPFLVMEHLEGRDLAQCIEHGPLPVVAAVEHVLQACQALAQVHALGVVHRDLKPANLFLTEDHGQPVIKVLDFGIFKSIAGAALNVGLSTTQLTGAHALIGSPVYMSPEQMRGDAVDARSDVWALGVILYELTTAQLPFGERTLSALAMAVATEEPAPPSRLQPSIPRGLDQVILRCLRKQPEDRYRHAGALYDALLPFRGVARAHRPRARTWLALGLAIAALLTLAWWSSSRPVPPTREPLSERSPAGPAHGQNEAQPSSPPISSDASAPPPVSTPVRAKAHEPDQTQVQELRPEAKPLPSAKRPRAVRAPKRPPTGVGPTDTPD